MKQNQHTSGPWVVEADGPRVLNGYAVYRIQISPHETIGSWQEWASSETRDANARLVAAAPELLALADYAQHRLDCPAHPLDDREGHCSCGLDAASDAIAKALGQPAGETVSQ